MFDVKMKESYIGTSARVKPKRFPLGTRVPGVKNELNNKSVNQIKPLCSLEISRRETEGRSPVRVVPFSVPQTTMSVWQLQSE